MDEYADALVAEHTWIEVGYIYNITFAKYKCEDIGMLHRTSLHKLRRHYVDYLRFRWDIPCEHSGG